MVNAKRDISPFLQLYSAKIDRAKVRFVFLTLDGATTH